MPIQLQFCDTSKTIWGTRSSRLTTTYLSGDDHHAAEGHGATYVINYFPCTLGSVPMYLCTLRALPRMPFLASVRPGIGSHPSVIPRLSTCDPALRNNTIVAGGNLDV